MSSVIRPQTQARHIWDRLNISHRFQNCSVVKKPIHGAFIIRQRGQLDRCAGDPVDCVDVDTVLHEDFYDIFHPHGCSKMHARVADYVVENVDSPIRSTLQQQPYHLEFTSIFGYQIKEERLLIGV